MKSSATPLPVQQTLAVFFVQMCEAMNITVLFPFLAFMVEDFGYTGHRLGSHAGILAAMFCGAQFFSAVPWGKFSDTYGRKPAVILGVLGTAIGMLVLGTASSYSQAIVGRAIAGILSGNLGVLKSFLTEITDDTNRGYGFSFLSLGWSLGAVVGPLAGGLLCYPADKYSTTFGPPSIFATYPFLLPCLICVGANIISGVYCCIFMKESRWAKEHKEDNYATPGSRGAYAPVSEEDDNIEMMDSSSHLTASSCENSELTGDCEEIQTIPVAVKSANISNSQSLQPAINKTSILAIMSYGLCCMTFIIVDETGPLMLKLHRQYGGLSYSSSEIGSVLSVSAGAMLLWTLFLLPLLSPYSKLMLFKISSVLCIPVILMYPILSVYSSQIASAAGPQWGDGVVYILLVIVITLRNCLATIVFLAVCLFVNHSVYDKDLGLINGLGQSVASVARAVGPAIGGFMWSLSVKVHIIFINYIVSILIVVVMYIIVLQLPPTIDNAKERSVSNPSSTTSGNKLSDSVVDKYELPQP